MPFKGDVSSGRNAEGIYSRSRESVDVASDISGSDIHYRIIARRNANVAILPLVDLVHESNVSINSKVPRVQECRQHTPLAQINCMVKCAFANAAEARKARALDFMVLVLVGEIASKKLPRHFIPFRSVSEE